MDSYFEVEFFAGNRSRLRELCQDSALIVAAANGQLQRNGDTTFPFRQDSSFWYLTGIDEPDITLVMDRDKEYLLVPGREAIREFFDGKLNPQIFTQISGIPEVLVGDDATKWFKNKLQQTKSVATLMPPDSYMEKWGMYTNPARSRLMQLIKDTHPDIDIRDIRMHLATLRIVKQAPELKALQKAIDITNDTLTDITRNGLRGYGHEYEIEADITAGFRKRGASGHAFTPIIAAGKNACSIHYLDNNAPLDKDGLVVIDVGAEVSNYAADITRTYSLKKPSSRQQAIYQAVLDVQKFALNQLKPGVLVKEYEKSIEHYMGEKLLELKLISVNESKEVRRYYPHATSHFLGLDAHDVGDYQKPLEPGMVLTVEPGIYIPEEGIGVRIEDDVLITKDGNKVLSSSLPRQLQ